MIYFSLVYSHLQYVIGAWGSTTKTSLHRLNTLHNKIIKTISWSSFRCHVTPLFSQLNLLKLEDMHQLEIAKLMHSFHSNRMPNTFDHLFTAVNCVHTHKFYLRPILLSPSLLPIWKKINQIQRPKNLAANRFLYKRITSSHLQKTI